MTLTANMPRLRFTDHDLEADISHHKVTKPAKCPECGSYCYYPSSGDSFLTCTGEGCGKTWKEEDF